MYRQSNETDLRVVSRLAGLERGILAAVAVVSGVILIFWYLPALAVHAPQVWSKMTAISAIATLLVVASMALSRPRRGVASLRAANLLAALVLALGATVLAAYAFKFSLEIPRWLPTDPRAANLGRPSPQTALFFCLCGACLLLIRRTRTAWSLVADIVTIAMLCLTLFLLGGYIFGGIDLVGVSSTNLTSPQTLACQLFIAFACGARRAKTGNVLAVLTTQGIGSRFLRLVLPGVVALPFIWLFAIGYVGHIGLMPVAYARAIGAPVMVMTAFAIIALLSRRLNKLESDLKLLSSTDELTGVLNRRGFYAVADYAMRNSQREKTPLVLFFFDLDGLKTINDELGHEIGSALIQRFAECLLSNFRKSDVVARIGGDEFIVLANSSDESAAEMLQRLNRASAKNNALSEMPGNIAFSAGYVDIPFLGDVGIDLLIAQADVRMYEQKAERKSAPRRLHQIAA